MKIRWNLFIAESNVEEDENEDEYEDEEDVEEIEIDEDDEQTLEAFAGEGKRQNLADLIMKKISEKQEEVTEIIGDEQPASNLPEDVAEHYAMVGNALASYRSGKMPKVARCSRMRSISSFFRRSNWFRGCIIGKTF